MFIITFNAYICINKKKQLNKNFMKNLFKITDAKIIIGMFTLGIALFITAAVLHPGGKEKSYSDYSETTIHGGWAADALTK